MFGALTGSGSVYIMLPLTFGSSHRMAELWIIVSNFDAVIELEVIKYLLCLLTCYKNNDHNKSHQNLDTVLHTLKLEYYIRVTH